MSMLGRTIFIRKVIELIKHEKECQIHHLTFGGANPKTHGQKMGIACIGKFAKDLIRELETQ
tara:strand:- start:125 stop:310 length:186 start_codon:yes stop_codon:yes gene_type:complete